MSYRGSICALPLVAALLAAPSAAQVVDLREICPTLRVNGFAPPATRIIGCGLPAFRRSHPSIARSGRTFRPT